MSINRRASCVLLSFSALFLVFLQVLPAHAANEKTRLRVDDYQINVVLQPHLHQMNATAKVKFTAMQDLNVAVFELHNDLRVTKVTDEKNQPLSAERVTQDSTIRVPLPNGLSKDASMTLTFEYDSELIDRLPKATEYKVTVPAGTKSETEGLLAESVSWTFRTPPPKIVTTYPDNSPQPLAPIFFIAFDQRIDPAAVLRTISVKAGSQDIGIALAHQTEIDKDERVSQLIKDAPEGRWLAFRAAQSLPPETSVSVSIGPGTPSAEGPLTTTGAQSFNFSTYAPLRIEEHRCYGYNDRCPPLSSSITWAGRT